MRCILSRLYRPLLGLLLFGPAVSAEEKKDDPRIADLAKEVHDKGWIVYGARSPQGDWDLFIMRPDGSDVRNLTNTPDFSEAAPRFSPDGKKLLYRRLPKKATIDHDNWGFQGGLIIAEPDGSKPEVIGADGDFPWASWSPDGKWFCGVANHQSEQWTVVRMDIEKGDVNPVNKFQNCTPDWFPDSKRIIFSHRPGNQGGYGWTQLWMADGDGSNRGLVFGEDGRHIYGGAISPDSKYVLFTLGAEDGSGPEKNGAPIGLMRLADAPTIRGESKALRKIHSNTKDGPVLILPVGWEPFWTNADVGATK